jgi:hypothetical protein
VPLEANLFPTALPATIARSANASQPKSAFFQFRALQPPARPARFVFSIVLDP